MIIHDSKFEEMTNEEMYDTDGGFIGCIILGIVCGAIIADIFLN